MFGFVGVALGYFCGVGTFYFSVCIGLHYVFCSYINTISKFYYPGSTLSIGSI